MTSPKRICLICVEIFAWGKYGGFGKSARIIGRELVKRGYEVFAVVPRREDQKEEEILDGITVFGFNSKEIRSSGNLYKKINADIYHSCEPSLGTWLAMKHVPHATHIVTSRDPRDTYDWWLEFSYPSKSRFQVIQNYFYEDNFLVHKSVRHADALFVPAHFLKEKVKKIYNYKREIQFLATPTEIRPNAIKAEKPTVVSMGRLDPRKRPELTLKVARNFPEVSFHMVGKARVPEYEKHLREKYSDCPNIHFEGFVNQFEGDGHHRFFSAAWILINTAIREGLPDSFVEGVGHNCAILSYVDPDHFASEYGFHAATNNFEEGLNNLLANNLWKEKGQKGFNYVDATYGVANAMEAHIEAYHFLFNQKRRNR